MFENVTVSAVWKLIMIYENYMRRFPLNLIFHPPLVNLPGFLRIFFINIIVLDDVGCFVEILVGYLLDRQCYC